jgi:hypothetical protein
MNIDWRFKATLQLFLSIIPLGENVNHILQKIYGGSKSLSVDDALYDGIRIIQGIKKYYDSSFYNSKMLEVGTGWQPVIPILLSFIGVKEIITIDHVRHLRLKLLRNSILQFYHEVGYINELLKLSELEIVERIKKFNRIDLDSSMENILNCLNIKYIAPGNASYTQLENNSLDLFFSNKVLEHVPKNQIISITKEAMRILKPGCLYYNYIGTLDHYSYFDKSISKCNFLQYSELAWRLLSKNKITYQNRLRNSDYLAIFKNCGFEILDVNFTIDKECLNSLKEMKLDSRFRNMAHNDLSITFTEIFARKPF